MFTTSQKNDVCTGKEIAENKCDSSFKQTEDNYLINDPGSKAESCRINKSCTGENSISLRINGKYDVYFRRMYRAFLSKLECFPCANHSLVHYPLH